MLYSHVYTYIHIRTSCQNNFSLTCKNLLSSSCKRLHWGDTCLGNSVRRYRNRDTSSHWCLTSNIWSLWLLYDSSVVQIVNFFWIQSGLVKNTLNCSLDIRVWVYECLREHYLRFMDSLPLKTYEPNQQQSTFYMQYWPSWRESCYSERRKISSYCPESGEDHLRGNNWCKQRIDPSTAKKEEEKRDRSWKKRNLHPSTNTTFLAAEAIFLNLKYVYYSTCAPLLFSYDMFCICMLISKQQQQQQQQKFLEVVVQ